jgi:hypothetical protein
VALPNVEWSNDDNDEQYDVSLLPQQHNKWFRSKSGAVGGNPTTGSTQTGVATVK